MNRLRHRQRMDMILNAPDLQRGQSMFSRDAADVRPNTVLNFLIYKIYSALRREDNVMEEIGICVRHSFVTALRSDDFSRGFEPTVN